MRRFKSTAPAQRYLWVHGLVLNLVCVDRHLLRAVHHRLLCTRAFGVWREVTCVSIGGLSRRLFGGGACSFNVNLTVSMISLPDGVTCDTGGCR